tara:strand:- start:1179 stop:2000 length:822 start_codon:yes stop_codon:yes gene_type:complete
MKYDLTIFIPAFRTPLWKKVYDSAKLSCKKYSWEMVFIGPFEPPEELKNEENVLFIQDYGTVTRCAQKGMLEIRSDLFFLTVDDCIFAEDSIDLAMDVYKDKCGYKDVVSMIYGEGGNKMDTSYWTVKKWGDFRLPGIDQSWRLANQCIMNKNYFIELGGLDCVNYEYIDKPIHDFMFRLQRDGGRIFFAPKHTCIATWYPEESGDHAPIHNAMFSHDIPTFVKMYTYPQFYKNRIKIHYENWQKSPSIWKRRFSKGVPSSYEELCEQEGYKV